MAKYILKRLLLIIPTLFGVSFLSFLFIHLAPGGPLENRLLRVFQLEPMASMTPLQLQELRDHYGYDKSILIRYLNWAQKLTTFDFGESDLFKAPVSEVLSRRVLVSWSYALISLPLCYLLAFAVSLLSLLYREVSIVSIVLASILFAAPPIVVALSLKYLFVSSDDGVVIICYVLVHFAMMVFLFKGSLDSEKQNHYVVAARAKGLSEMQVLTRHVLRNALLPIVTSLSYSVLAFFSGSLFIETVFGIDGLGMVAYRAFWARDYNLIMGIVFGLSGLFITTRLISDALYGFVDPRVKS